MDSSLQYKQYKVLLILSFNSKKKPTVLLRRTLFYLFLLNSKIYLIPLIVLYVQRSFSDLPDNKYSCVACKMVDQCKTMQLLQEKDEQSSG